MINPFPKVIEFQTHNMCNANCIICPYSTLQHTRNIMEDDLFRKIIIECKENKIERLVPYLNNEPFLDKTFVSKLQFIRKELPNIELEISTNASLLTKEIIKDLSKINLTELRISVFGFTGALHKKIMPGVSHEKVFTNVELIAKYFEKSSCLVSIVMIDNGDIDEIEFEQMDKYSKSLGFNFFRWGFLDRANNVKDFSNVYYDAKAHYCEQRRPLERMHILTNGDVIFCCQDWGHEEIVGNISNQTLKEVWNSRFYNLKREQLYSPEKEAPEICKRCILSKGCDIYDRKNSL